MRLVLCCAEKDDQRAFIRQELDKFLKEDPITRFPLFLNVIFYVYNKSNAEYALKVVGEICMEEIKRLNEQIRERTG